MHIEELNRILVDAVKGYLTCALWTTLNAEDENNFDINDFADAEYYTAVVEVSHALQAAPMSIWMYGNKRVPHEQGLGCTLAEQFGYDFWLTRNHHGTGFWDRTEVWSENTAKLLTEQAHATGEATVYAHNGKVFFS